MPEVTGTSSENIEKNEPVDSSDSAKPVANGTSENGVSSTNPEKKSPEKSEAEALLAQGKRHLFVKDFPNAVSVLGDACAKLSEMYGDLADECAEAYFCYGRALLELAREESTGNVLGTEPEKEDSEEEEENKNENDEAEAKTDEDGKSTEGTEKDNEEKESVADETIDTTKEVNEDEEADEEKEDDVDNLQLAWEVFELAKNIFERQKADARLAETYLYLGEVGLESENYVSAIEDMKRCIEIQKKTLPPDHRDIAETFYQLGVACSLCNEFDDAILHFKDSIGILETRIKNLQEKGAPQAETEKNPFYSVEKEIDEIKALLPEIKTKITDMEDFKQETIKSVMAKISGDSKTSDGAGPSSASVSNGSPQKPVTDISHLVRKKRKPEEEDSLSSVKKPCTDEANK